MGSLIRSSVLWGYDDLVSELSGDPKHFLSRFGIPPGVENQEDAFISFDAYVRMLETSADDLRCPDFGLRLSRWQGLDLLGPIAVIARNAQTLLGGLEAIVVCGGVVSYVKVRVGPPSVLSASSVARTWSV